MEKCFTDVYENKVWGSNNVAEYIGSSGPGSDVNYNKNTYVPFLKNFITANNVKTIVDLGCGDFRCGKLHRPKRKMRQKNVKLFYPVM
jgi:hypothetical protein